MKTYGRKRTEEAHDLILNLDELCRLCLAKEEKLLPIFNEDDPVPLPIRIMACVALEVVENDGLPTRICHPCHYQLERYYVFRKKCENSDLKLRRHLKNIKDKDLSLLPVNENMPGGNENNTTDSQTNRGGGSPYSESKDMTISESIEYPVGASVEYIMGTTGDYGVEESSGEDETKDITLSMASAERAAVTITEQEEEYISDNEDISQAEGTDLLARAVCATLNSIIGTETNTKYPHTLEVITEDGTLILMDLISIDEAQMRTNESITMLPASTVVKLPSVRELCVIKEKVKHQPTERGITCDVCMKWFSSKSALMRHFRIHTGEKPFTCPVCGRGFAQKEILKRHQLTHLEVRPFTCDKCGRGFTQREPLRRHLQRHSTCRERPIYLHKCEHCPKVFCHPSGLSRHSSTHSGRKFKCRVCSRQFADKSSLRRHLKISQHQDGIMISMI